MDSSPPGSSSPWDVPGKNTGVGCHFPPPGDLPDPGTEPGSLVSPALADRFLTTSTAWETLNLKRLLLRNLSQCIVIACKSQPRGRSLRATLVHPSKPGRRKGKPVPAADTQLLWFSWQDCPWGTSLVGQWLRSHADSAVGAGSIPDQRTKIQQAMQHDQKVILKLSLD